MRWSVLLACCALLCAGCGPDVDLTKALQVEVVSTGWFDAGIVNGREKRNVAAQHQFRRHTIDACLSLGSWMQMVFHARKFISRSTR